MIKRRKKSETLVLLSIRKLNKKVERMIKTMATRAELNNGLTNLGTVLQALLDKISAGEDFAAEIAVIQGMIDKINTANPPPPTP